MTHILLVDDDSVLVNTLASLLESEGYPTTVRANSSGIYKLVEQDPPELIILDYFLPGENGVEIAAHFKSVTKTKAIPIIMISSSYGVESLARKAGVEAFLPKPFDIDRLVSTIDRLVGN